MLHAFCMFKGEHDNPKKFDQLQKETLMALEKEPEAYILKGHYFRHLENRLSFNMLWRCIFPIKFTSKSRRAA